MADKIKLGLAFVIAVAAVGGFYILGAQPVAVRLGVLVAGEVVAVALLLQSQVGIDAWGYLKNVRTEVRKMVWPSNKETTQVTLMVLGVVILAGLMLWIIDFFLIKAVGLLTGTGS